MKQLKNICLFLVGFVLIPMMTSCKDTNDDIDPRHEKVEANAKGIRVLYSDKLELDNTYFWINSDIIKCTGENYEEYKSLVEGNYINRAYYPLTIDNAKELILENSGWFDIKDVYEYPDTKALYEYAVSVISRYQYVSYDYGLLLFNRTSDVNY